MTKRLESKHKLSRRLGVNLWGRPKSPVNRREYRPGQHGQRRSKPSDYGIQLMAKQRLRGYYGNIGERCFYRYYEEALRLRGDSAENLIKLLERRLDTVVYRLKFAATVFAARQLISHGHVMVNGKRVNIASYRLKDSDAVELSAKARKMAVVQIARELAERDVPDYISFDEQKFKGTYLRSPALGDVPYPVQMEPNLVIEFYSR